MIDWLDITLHSIPAVLWGAACGVGAALGDRFKGVLGGTLEIASMVALAAGVLFWLVRELEQHNRQFGGVQSNLEWLVPALAGMIAFLSAAAFYTWLGEKSRR